MLDQVDEDLSRLHEQTHFAVEDSVTPLSLIIHHPPLLGAHAVGETIPEILIQGLDGCIHELRDLLDGDQFLLQKEAATFRTLSSRNN